MNNVTVNFIPCTPAPANGYRLTWRVAGTEDAYTDEGLFTSSPIIFTDLINPEGTCYEGFLQSDCSESGESGTLVGQAVAWATPCDEESGTPVYAFLVRANDGTVGICGQIPMLVYSSSPSIAIGTFIYFDEALTMPVGSYYYIVEGNQDEPGIIYVVSTSGEITAHSGILCSM